MEFALKSSIPLHIIIEEFLPVCVDCYRMPVWLLILDLLELLLTLHSNPIYVITKTILLSWSLWLGFGHGCRNIEIVLVTDWFELVWESGILQTSVREGLSHRKIELKWILDQPLAFQASDRPSMHFWWQTNVIKGEWPYPSKSELYCQYSLLLDSLISYLSSL